MHNREPCLLHPGGLRDTAPDTGNCLGISHKIPDLYQDCGQWYMNPCSLCQRAGYRPEATNAGPEQTTQAPAARTEPSPDLTAPLNTNTRQSLEQSDVPDQWPFVDSGPGVVSGDKRPEWQGMTSYVVLPMTMPAHRAFMNVMTGGRGVKHYPEETWLRRKICCHLSLGMAAHNNHSARKRIRTRTQTSKRFLLKVQEPPMGKKLLL